MRECFGRSDFEFPSMSLTWSAFVDSKDDLPLSPLTFLAHHFFVSGGETSFARDSGRFVVFQKCGVNLDA